MSTIVGGMSVGLKREVAAEFSFFLAVPTMLGAFLLEVIKFWKSDSLYILQEHWLTLLVGNVVSFVVAMVAIQTFIRYLKRHGFAAFGIYRILVGGVILALMGLGVELAIV